mgnify:CR=1 FL=1
MSFDIGDLVRTKYTDTGLCIITGFETKTGATYQHTYYSAYSFIKSKYFYLLFERKDLDYV